MIWRKGIYVLMILMAIGILCAGIVSAADESREGVYTLGEIIVSDEHDKIENIGTVFKVTDEYIQHSGAQNLADVLKTIPGINVRVGGEGTPRIDIRGFKTRHVLLLLDGIPINDTYDGQFDPTSFPVEHIAEVKVVTGGSSVLYGTGGMGGVINIITKKGIKGIHGSLTGEAGSEDAELTKATLSGGTEKLDFFVSRYTESRDAFPLSDDFEPTEYEDGDERENSDFERSNLFANMGYAFSDKTKMGLTVNWLNGENGLPYIVNYDATDPFAAKKPKYDRLDDMEGVSVQAAFSKKMDSPLGFRGWVYVNTLDLEENRYDDETCSTQDLNGAYRSESTTQITGIHVQTSYDHTKSIRGTLGVIAEKHSWDASGFNMVKAGKAVKQEDFDDEYDIRISSVALEYEISPTDYLGFVLGIGDHFMKGDDIDSDNDTSFLIGARYDITDKTVFKGSFSKKVRFPSIKQLYDTSSGNDDLNAEKAYEYEIGLLQQLPAATSLSVSAFYSTPEDYIEKDEDGVYQNYEEYLLKGVDVSLENRIIDNLMVRAAYSYLYSEDKSDNAERDELQYRPKHKYYLEGTYTFGFGLMMHADVLRVTDQYFYDGDNVDPLEKKKLNDYTIVGAKVSQSFFNNMMDVYVRATNIFDQDYEQSYGLPQAGKTVYGGVGLRF